MGFRFDSTDSKLLREIMRKYGDSKDMFTGKSIKGELMTVSVSPTGIVTNVYQDNGWVRVNYFDEMGYPSGETFDGRWK